MSFLVVGGELGVSLALYLFHAVILAVPLAALLVKVGRAKSFALFAFVPLVSRLICVWLFASMEWHKPVNPLAEMAAQRGRRALTLLAPVALLAALVVMAWTLPALLSALSGTPANHHFAIQLLGLSPRGEFFLHLFLASAASLSLVLFYIWSLWRATLLVCRRSGYADFWALYIFVPGFNVLLPWILNGRWQNHRETLP